MKSVDQGVEMAKEDRVTEYNETRSNTDIADAGTVFGQMKFNLRFSIFRLRGLDRAGEEWMLICPVRNIKKIYALIMAKGGELYNPMHKRGVFF